MPLYRLTPAQGAPSWDDADDVLLAWLHEHLGRDVVPADAVLDAAAAAGHGAAGIKALAKDRLIEQRSGGRVYWSRPWSPADLAALAVAWRQGTRA